MFIDDTYLLSIRHPSRKGLAIWILLTFLGIIPSISAQIAQTSVISSLTMEVKDDKLDHMFAKHQRILLSNEKLFDLVHEPDFDNEINWKLGDLDLQTTLFEHDLRADDYQLEIYTSNGIQHLERTPCTTYRGWSKGAGEVRLSITAKRISGFFTDEQGMEFYIQPVQDFVDTDETYSILYRKKDVIADPNRVCGSSHRHEIGGRNPSNKTNKHARSMACVSADAAIAADYSMYQEYGSNVSTLEAHLLSLKNMEEASYAFYPVEFSVVKTTIITSAGGDPWTNSLNASTLLDDFSCWAGSGSSSQLNCTGSNGFGIDHDIGELWTNRDFSGSTVGVGWIGTVCSGMFSYSVNQDRDMSLEGLRVLISHEQGHNFGASHYSGVWIMNASVDPNATSFSPTSQTTITNEIATFTCLGACGGGGGNCNATVTVTPGNANATHQASVMITTSGSLVINSQAVYDAPTVQINSTLQVMAGSTFTIMSNGCN